MNKLFSLLALVTLISFSQSWAFIDAIKNFNGDYGTIPTNLSESGMYTDLPNKVINPDLVFYEVNTPYWVDGTKKERWIWVPPGSKITPNDTNKWEYPEGTVIAKNFYLETVVGDPNSKIAIETRLLVKRADTQWKTISYEWLDDQSNAQLYPKEKNKNVVYAISNNGEVEYFRWQYPGEFTCNSCHLGAVGTAVGITAQNLNRPSSLTPGKNQLEDLFEKGILDINVYTPELFAYAGLDDAGASNEVKSRSWFYMNCAYCHSKQMQQHGASHEFDYYTGTETPNYLDIESFTPGYPKLIYPGYPDSSRFLHRLAERSTFDTYNGHAMPPLLTYKPDSKAIAVISSWICELDNTAPCNDVAMPDFVTPQQAEFLNNPGKYPIKNPAGLTKTQDDTKLQASLFNGIINHKTLVVLGPQNAKGSVQLFDISGKKVELQPLTEGEYLIRGQLQRGIYLLKSGSQSVKIAYYP